MNTLLSWMWQSLPAFHQPFHLLVVHVSLNPGPPEQALVEDSAGEDVGYASSY
jgi:hypothetical protein